MQDTRDTERTHRYGQVGLEDESMLIYDRENHDRWIRSTAVLDVDAMR